MEQIVIITPDNKTVPLETKGAVTKITKAEQRIKLLGEDVAILTIESPYPQEFGLGAKTMLFGREYTLNQLPVVKRKGEHSFTYDLTFEGIQYQLARAAYEVSLDTTGAEAYSDALMGDLRRFMEVLIANANRIFPGKWKLGDCPDTDTRNLVFNCENCLSVLQRLCGEFNQEFEIVQQNGTFILHIRTSGSIFPFSFEYGKGRGMYELTRQNVSNSNIVTRLKVFGGTKNLGSKYRNDRVCLPGKTKSKSYLENAEAVKNFGIWENTKHFDEIYPKRTGYVSAKSDSVFKFVDKDMFDLNAKDSNGTLYLIDSVPAKIHFNTGNLAGYQFDIHAYDHTTKTFTLKKEIDDRGMTFPSETSSAFQIGPGDEYVLLDINLPQSYIDGAESDLAKEGETYLNQNCQPKVQYGLAVQENFLLKFVGDNSVVDIFMVGDYVPIKDKALNVDKAVRITGFSRNLLKPYQYSLTIGDSVETNIYTRIISELTDIDRIIQINDLTDPAKARRKWLSSQELLGMIFDPEGDYYTSKIKPESIETLMLSVGSKSMQFILQNTLIEANYNGNKNSVRVTGGTLSHYTIEESTRNWTLSTATTTLSGDANSFYIYARCAKTGTSGSIIFSTTQYKVDSDANNYHFWIGVVHSVIDNVRGISLTYGSTTINGKFIRTGKIESSDGNNYLDLDGNQFRVGNSSSALEWNKNNDGKLRLIGTMVQSKSGTESPLGVWRGTYSSSTTYYPGDEVAYTANGVLSSYRRIGTANTSNIAPTNTTHWNLFAQGSKGDKGDTGAKGDKGATGATGPQGPAGATGAAGAGIVFRGTYSSTATYYGNASRLDIVKYNNIYYMALRTAGSFSGVVPTNTSKWENFGAQFDSIATNLLLAEGANIGDWSMEGGKIVSTLTGSNKITLDAKSAKITVASARTGGAESSSSAASTLTMDAASGYMEARNSSGVSYITANGIFSNNANTNAVSAVTGTTRKAAVVGLGYGTVNKSDWQNENFLAGVYGIAENKGSAPAYGGYFRDLFVAGLILHRQAYDNKVDAEYHLPNYASMVIGYSNKRTTVYLPNDGVMGKTIFFKQWWTGSIRIRAKGGQSLWDDSTKNDYFDIGEGYGAILTFTIGYINNVKTEAWLFNRYKW